MKEALEIIQLSPLVLQLRKMIPRATSVNAKLIIGRHRETQFPLGCSHGINLWKYVILRTEMLRKEDLRTETGTSESITLLMSVGKDKVKKVGVLLLMCDTLPQKFVTLKNNNTYCMLLCILHTHISGQTFREKIFYFNF